MPATLCTNLKSATAAARGECVKATKSACSVMAATSREFIGDPELTPWGLLNSCLLPLTQKQSLKKAAALAHAEHWPGRVL